MAAACDWCDSALWSWLARTLSTNSASSTMTSTTSRPTKQHDDVNEITVYLPVSPLADGAPTTPSATTRAT
eukprot:9332739-Pyramimonas_sp.AAC.1